MAAQAEGMTPRAAARWAGLLYLLVIAGGLFAEGFVRGPLIVNGDVAATVRNLIEHESLYRAGFAVHLAYQVCALGVAVILYGLLRPASARLALLMLCFDVVAIATESLNLLNLLAPLRLLGDAGLAALPAEQLHAMAYAQVRLFGAGFGISLVFFGGFCVTAGVLLYRSRRVPRVLGVLMGIAGACYVVNSFALFLLPDVASRLFPWILLPCLVAELSLALWLLAKGVREPA